MPKKLTFSIDWFLLVSQQMHLIWDSPFDFDCFDECFYGIWFSLLILWKFGNSKNNLKKLMFDAFSRLFRGNIVFRCQFDLDMYLFHNMTSWGKNRNRNHRKKEGNRMISCSCYYRNRWISDNHLISVTTKKKKTCY